MAFSAQSGVARSGASWSGSEDSVADPAIYPASLGSVASLGSPSVSPGGAPDSLGTVTTLGDPAVTLDVLPDSLGDVVTLGTPTNGPIYPTALSPVTVGSPAVGRMRAVVPDGFNPVQFGIPTLGGGAQAIQVYVAGVNVTKYYQELSCQISSQTIGRWQMTIRFHCGDGQFSPRVDHTIIVTEYGRTLFSGGLNEIQTAREMSTEREVIYHCTAVDYAGLFDHRTVEGRKYTSDQDGTAVLLDVMSFMSGEGLSSAGIPASLGALGSDQDFTNPTIATQVMDAVCELLGCVWWVDVYHVVNVSPLVDLPAAPFALTETSENWRNLISKESLLAYRNRQWVVSNLTVLPGGATITESYTWTTDGVRVLAGPNGLPEFAILKSSIQKINSITVNGHAQTVVDFAQWSGQTSSGPNDYLWFYGVGNKETGPSFGPLPPGASVVISYVPGSKATSGATVGEALDPPLPSGGYGGWGSGIFEHVEHVHDIDNVSDLNAIARAILNVDGGLPTFAQFETDWHGLQPGQILTANVPKSGLDNRQLLITSVNGTSMGGNLKKKAGQPDGSFRWQIVATSQLDPGNKIKWFERLVRKTNNPLPVPRYGESTIIIEPGGSLSTGAISTNPLIVNQSGIVYELVLATSDPNTGQDLLLTFFVNGTNQLGQVTIPDGTPANLAIVVPVTDLYVAKNDVITGVAQYNPTTGTRKAAGSVTAIVRYRY